MVARTDADLIANALLIPESNTTWDSYRRFLLNLEDWIGYYWANSRKPRQTGLRSSIGMTINRLKYNGCGIFPTLKMRKLRIANSSLRCRKPLQFL